MEFYFSLTSLNGRGKYLLWKMSFPPSDRYAGRNMEIGSGDDEEGTENKIVSPASRRKGCVGNVVLSLSSGRWKKNINCRNQGNSGKRHAAGGGSQGKSVLASLQYEYIGSSGTGACCLIKIWRNLEILPMGYTTNWRTITGRGKDYQAHCLPFIVIAIIFVIFCSILLKQC